MSLFLNGNEINDVIWNGNPTTGYFNGNMVWGEYKGYHEELLWSGYIGKGQVAHLNNSPINYDAVRVYGKAGNFSTLNNNQTSYSQIIPKYYFENNNKLTIRYPMWSTIVSTSASTMWFMNQLLSGVSGSNWSAVSNFGFKKTTTGGTANTANWICLREVWGIKYE